MCKHSDLTPGKMYNIEAKDSTCLRCGGLMPYRGMARYVGHQEDSGVTNARFDFASTIFCAGCGDRLGFVFEACGLGNYYEIETSILVENWPIKKEAINE